uniref:H(+)-exporting diphosphatase n=1 Tax=Steinernema glaseri TaxID=37863 RepID=A0A1I7Y212_9BILA
MICGTVVPSVIKRSIEQGAGVTVVVVGVVDLYRSDRGGACIALSYSCSFAASFFDPLKVVGDLVFAPKDTGPDAEIRKAIVALFLVIFVTLIGGRLGCCPSGQMQDVRLGLSFQRRCAFGRHADAVQAFMRSDHCMLTSSAVFVQLIKYILS